MVSKYEVIVIGAGQAGLAAGYHLARRGVRFIILDGSPRIGDSWRSRWDSLRLFTPARYDGLPGMRFPAPAHYFPTKDEMGDFLEAYAAHFQLPVRTGMRVERLWKEGEEFLVSAGGECFAAQNVVVAMANYQQPWRPAFAAQLDPAIVQIHSAEYKNPSQLQPGKVLIVGAGNSGSEIAMELAATHPILMSGRHTGQLPFRISSRLAHWLLIPVVLRGLFYRVMTVKTPLGRKARPKIIAHGGPLIRVKRGDMEAAGIQSVPRLVGVQDGKPILEDGRSLEVENIVWCTGYHPGFSWIDLPVMGEKEPLHVRGVVPTQPGLFFVGLHFLYSLSSSMIQGVGRDAEFIAGRVADRLKSPARQPAARERRGAPSL
jgi:putative flavoprotein involved in K+ transport